MGSSYPIYNNKLITSRSSRTLEVLNRCAIFVIFFFVVDLRRPNTNERDWIVMSSSCFRQFVVTSVGQSSANNKMADEEVLNETNVHCFKIPFKVVLFYSISLPGETAILLPYINVVKITLLCKISYPVDETE